MGSLRSLTEGRCAADLCLSPLLTLRAIEQITTDPTDDTDRKGTYSWNRCNPWFHFAQPACLTGGTAAKLKLGSRTGSLKAELRTGRCAAGV